MLSNTNIRPEQAGLFREGAQACFPTLPGYWSIGIAAGAIGTLSGFSLLHITLLASCLYAGSAHFLFYSLWAAGAETASIVLSVLLVNLRYLLMSSSISLFFQRSTTYQKIVSGLLLTDETFGVAVQYGNQCGEIPFKWMLGLNLTAWINWIISCVLGAWLASSLPAALMEGLSFSLVSMFIGLILMTWFASKRQRLETLTIVTAMAITLLFHSWSNTSLVVIFAASVAATLATIVLIRMEKKGK